LGLVSDWGLKLFLLLLLLLHPSKLQIKPIPTFCARLGEESFGISKIKLG
jgi:hypothetical protein